MLKESQNQTWNVRYWYFLHIKINPAQESWVGPSPEAFSYVNFRYKKRTLETCASMTSLDFQRSMA